MGDEGIEGGRIVKGEGRREGAGRGEEGAVVNMGEKFTDQPFFRRSKQGRLSGVIEFPFIFCHLVRGKFSLPRLTAFH